MSKAIEIAAERYAKGEISRQEFEEIRESLAQGLPSAKPHSIGEDLPPTGSADSRGSASRHPSGHSPQFRETKAIFGAFVILLAITLVVQTIFLALLKINRGWQNQFNLAYQFDNNPVILGLMGLPTLAAIVFFLIWKKRSTENLIALRGPQTITPAGAIYWYFVPVAWFWKPYEAMKNLYDGYGANAKGLSVLGWWIVFWAYILLSILVSSTVPQTISTQQQAESYVFGSGFLSVIDVIMVGVGIHLVVAIENAQQIALSQAFDESSPD